MIGTQFTLTNKANPSRTITFNDHSGQSFIALQAYPTFEMEVRNDEIIKEGQHGIWDFFSFYGKRLISFDGVIIGTTEAEVITIKDLLQSVVELPSQPITGDDGTVIVSWTDPLGRAVQTEAKISTTIHFKRNMRETYRLDFLMVLKSANPVIESQELFTDDGLRAYPTAGMTLPFTLPDLLSSSYINKVTVVNGGNTEAEITVRLYGGTTMSINNPTITNLTTRKSMTINVILTDATKYVSINSQTGEVLDQDGNDISGSIAGGSEFVRLVVGSNEIIYLSDESVGESSPLVTRIDPVEIVETEHRDAIL